MRVGEQIEHAVGLEFVAGLGKQTGITRARCGVATDQYENRCLCSDQRIDSPTTEAGPSGIRDDETGGLGLPFLDRGQTDRRRGACR